jgi:ribonuclease D
MDTSTNSLPRSPKNLIDTPAGLAEVCRHLADSRVFGFDTEFIGETSYRPILCLFQVASDERVELIDPLALPDLTPFWDLLADASIEKICHAGDQDLAIAWQMGRQVPKNIFDCQIGAGFVGIGYPVAYWRLVEQISGIELEKAHTYSAWDRRPLSGSQFTYAVDDVLYLPAIWRDLRNRIDALGHTQWMVEACAELCARCAVDPDIQNAFARIKGAATLESRQLAVLRELAILREQMAFEHDVPARVMLKDDAVIDLAVRGPENLPALRAIRSVPKEEAETYADQIFAAVKRGKAVPPDQRPRLGCPTDDSTETKRLAEIMYAASQVICLGQSVSPSLVTSQAEILTLARLVADNADTSAHPLMSGWARECLGQPLVDFVAGKTRLDLSVTPDRMHADFKPTA